MRRPPRAHYDAMPLLRLLDYDDAMLLLRRRGYLGLDALHHAKVVVDDAAAWVAVVHGEVARVRVAVEEAVAAQLLEIRGGERVGDVHLLRGRVRGRARVRVRVRVRVRARVREMGSLALTWSKPRLSSSGMSEILTPGQYSMQISRLVQKSGRMAGTLTDLKFLKLAANSSAAWLGLGFELG